MSKSKYLAVVFVVLLYAGLLTVGIIAAVDLAQ